MFPDLWTILDTTTVLCYIETFTSIGLDKSGYQVNIFLISPQKHMLRVLIRSASVRHF